MHREDWAQSIVGERVISGISEEIEMVLLAHQMGLGLCRKRVMFPPFSLAWLVYLLLLGPNREEAFPAFLLMQRSDEKAHLFTRIRCDRRSSSSLSLS